MKHVIARLKAARGDTAGVTDTVGVSMSAAPPPEASKSTVGGVFHLVCRDAAGNIEWEADAHNTLANDGAAFLRDQLFKANTPAVLVSAPYIGMLTATPTTATTLATMTEATGGGYVRKLPTWTTTSAPAGANNTASAASWTASGTAITAVTYLFITEQSSGTTGKFLAFAALTGGPYTVNVGSTLNVTYSWSIT